MFSPGHDLTMIFSVLLRAEHPGFELFSIAIKCNIIFNNKVKHHSTEIDEPEYAHGPSLTKNCTVYVFALAYDKYRGTYNFCYMVLHTTYLYEAEP